ncbi:TraB/GumN family protein [uncultured Hoeflea sp.]|uniref:TraB/GumN family protein n=1 Tax=uncultured Hoeflea sp. TaxID=538666 RepID=UPI00260958C4|nr:TraB/GumN family protein [uncultured Hoeflea sp.]
MRHLPSISPLQASCARLPGFAFVVAAALPLILLILLAAGLIMGTSQARASTGADAACDGSNLVAELAETKPEALAAARAEAASVPNGRGVLWKIEKTGIEPSWLFGTMHVTDPRVTAVPDPVRSALEVSDTVVIETIDILDPLKAQAALMTRPELTMFTGDGSLTAFLDETEAELVEAELADRGIPLALVSKMKPWMISGMLALPPCELARKAGGAEFLDIKIANDAKRAGKTLLGLESIGEQMSAMADLPMEFHIRGLVETIRLADLMPDIMATMTELYLQGEIALIMPAIMAAGPEASDEDAAGYAEFEQRIVLMRNHVMAERAAPILARGNAFIAVGALHLPGEEGLVSLLRQAGYTVSAAM